MKQRKGNVWGRERSRDHASEMDMEEEVSVRNGRRRGADTRKIKVAQQSMSYRVTRMGKTKKKKKNCVKGHQGIKFVRSRICKNLGGWHLRRALIKLQSQGANDTML